MNQTQYDSSNVRRPGCRMYLYPALVVAVTFIAVEFVCFIYYLYLQREWSALISESDHYYVKSPDRMLGYALKPNTRIEKDGKLLTIGNNGLRTSTASKLTPEHIIAILGDSIVFGVGLSEQHTISSQLQAIYNSHGDAVGVKNFGVPGYSSQELLRFLDHKSKLIKPHRVVYVLNANDFSRRHSIYEGADNGLFRMYNPPASKALWIIRKMVYRLRKGGTLRGTPSHGNGQIVSWYQWLYAGNREAVFADILAMRRVCENRGMEFAVLPLPPGSVLAAGDFALQAEFAQIYSFLNGSDIPVINIEGRVSSDLFDDTDHLTASGNKKLANIIWDYYRNNQRSDTL